MGVMVYFWVRVLWMVGKLGVSKCGLVLVVISVVGSVLVMLVRLLVFSSGNSLVLIWRIWVMGLELC